MPVVVSSQEEAGAASRYTRGKGGEGRRKDVCGAVYPVMNRVRGLNSLHIRTSSKYFFPKHGFLVVKGVITVVGWQLAWRCGGDVLLRGHGAAVLTSLELHSRFVDKVFEIRVIDYDRYMCFCPVCFQLLK